MKKILIVTPTLTTGGMERVLVNLVNSLDQNKYDITIKTIYDKFDLAKDLKSNIKYSSLYTSSKNKRFDYIKVRFYTLMLKKISPKTLYKFLIREKFDTEIAFFRGASVKIISGSNNKKSKKLAWVHNDFSKCTGIFDWFNSEEETIEAYKKFDNIVCVSKYTKQRFIERMKISKNVIVRYNVNLCEYIKLKSNEKIDEKFHANRLKVCTVGRLVEAKGYDRLLQAHKKLIGENIIYDLIIVGDGPEKNNLDKFIRENNLVDTVYLLGNKTNPYKYIKNSDLFICSSRWEGFSTVISEAVILEKPVITTNVSGAEELFLNSEYGYIVENNTESIYEGLKEMITNKQTLNYYKAKIKERSDFFNTEKAVNNIVELF